MNNLYQQFTYKKSCWFKKCTGVKIINPVFPNLHAYRFICLSLEYKAIPNNYIEGQYQVL